jgi:hypothetical protein
LEKDGAGNSAILHLLPGSLSRNNGSEFKYQQGRGFKSHPDFLPDQAEK